MKAKVLVQILIIAILGTVTVQAQENINREVKRDLRKAKREMRKVRKDLKNDMKDFHMDNLEDVLEDLNVEIEGLEFIYEFEPLEHIMELEHIIELEHLEQLEHLEEFEHLNFEMPEMVFEASNFDIRTPMVYEYNNFYSEQGSVLELSKDLEDVSVSKDFFFDVEDGTKSINMNIDGALQSGDLTITVLKPDGELFQKFQISPLADVDWSQQISLEEEESYKGKWTINLSGKGATGNYSLKFRAK